MACGRYLTSTVLLPKMIYVEYLLRMESCSCLLTPFTVWIEQLGLLQQVVEVYLFLQLMVLCNRHGQVLLNLVVLSLISMILLIHALVILILQSLGLDLLIHTIHLQWLQDFHKHQLHNHKGWYTKYISVAELKTCCLLDWRSKPVEKTAARVCGCIILP